jgi:hypothetical protein
LHIAASLIPLLPIKFVITEVKRKSAVPLFITVCSQTKIRLDTRKREPAWMQKVSLNSLLIWKWGQYVTPKRCHLRTTLQTATQSSQSENRQNVRLYWNIEINRFLWNFYIDFGFLFQFFYELQKYTYYVKTSRYIRIYYICWKYQILLIN